MRRRLRIAAVAAGLLIATACSSAGDDAAVGAETPTSDTAPSDDLDSEATGDEPSATVDSQAPEDDPAPDFTTPLLDEERREGVPDRPSDYVVAYYGDSVASSVEEQFSTYLDWGLRIETLNQSFPGLPVCVFQDQISDDIETGIWGAVLLFSNTIFAECMQDENGEPLAGEARQEKFRADMEMAVDTLTAGGVRVYLPTLPIARHAVGEEDPDTDKVNRLLAELAERHELIQLVDAAPAVLTPSGDYAEYLPCFEYEPCLNGTTEDGTGVNLVRETDGGHFCTGGFYDFAELDGACPAWPSGAIRYAMAIAQPVIEDAYAEFSASG